MKTSIEWLFEELNNCLHREEVCDLLHELRSELEAKHKEEIMNAYLDGDSNGCGCYDWSTEEGAQEYYNSKNFIKDGSEQN
jgi:hypothetical protein